MPAEHPTDVRADGASPEPAAPGAPEAPELSSVANPRRTRLL